MALRNLAFDRAWLPSYQSKVPSIVVGNLSVGGTGKTPMVELLLRLQIFEKPAVVSRGYGRKSRGLLKVKPQGDASQYGDESLQIAQKFPECQLWVSEERKLGALEAEAENCDGIIYDDAFQHRYVKGHFQILLSSYDRPFYLDYVLPAGRLRELRRGAKRADAIILSKCPSHLSEKEQNLIRSKIALYSNAPVFFARLSYGELRNHEAQSPKASSVEIITAIAKPEPFIAEIKTHYHLKGQWTFKDHHLFRLEDLKAIWAKEQREDRTWVCSEKDYVKLAPLFRTQHKLDQLFYLPVEHQFLNGDLDSFKSLMEERFSIIKD